jgi:general secretion pathway protein H
LNPIYKNKGFTLLELIVVLFIIVLGFSVVGINFSSGSPMQLQGAARDLVSALRYAHGTAKMSHKETTVNIDLDDNSYTISSRDKVYRIPESIALSVVTAQSQLTGRNQGNIRFFADGSSTGGRITLERNAAKWQIDINWLTGQIELEQK